MTETQIEAIKKFNPRKNWTKEDYYAEQTYDSDCNNCKFIQRVPFDRLKEQPHIFGQPAFCTKWNKSVRAYHVGQFTAHPCFVHIRTGAVSPHVHPNPVEDPKYCEA